MKKNFLLSFFLPSLSASLAIMVAVLFKMDVAGVGVEVKKSYGMLVDSRPSYT